MVLHKTSCFSLLLCIPKAASPSPPHFLHPHMHTCQAAHRACILKMAPCSSHVLHSASCKWSISRPSTSHTRKPFSPHPVSLLHPFNLHGRERRCHNLTETFRFPNWCSLYKLTFLLQKDKFSCEGRDALAPSNTGLKKRLYRVLNRTRLTEAVFVFLQCQAFPSTHWQNKPPFWASHKKTKFKLLYVKAHFSGDVSPFILFSHSLHLYSLPCPPSS